MNDQKIDINDDMLEKATGGDGTLPGGMPPEMLQKLGRFCVILCCIS